MTCMGYFNLTLIKSARDLYDINAQFYRDLNDLHDFVNMADTNHDIYEYVLDILIYVMWVSAHVMCLSKPVQVSRVHPF